MTHDFQLRAVSVLYPRSKQTRIDNVRLHSTRSKYDNDYLFEDPS